MKKNLLLYLLIMGFFIALLVLILKVGHSLEGAKMIPANLSASSIVKDHPLLSDFLNNLQHPLAILLLQIMAIILAARILGYIMVKIGQPTVIGEIIAGIILGPSVVGTWFPEFSAFLFPVDSLKNLQFISQIGLILFMFVIGMELDLSILKKKTYNALVISQASIVFPYFCGVGLAYFLYRNFAPPSISFIPFALFMGIAMSITAFPVLARIVQERGMTKTPLGIMVIICAAANDVTAWCLLAMVIAIVNAGAISSVVLTIFFASLYVFLMVYAVRPLLLKISERYFTQETMSKPVLASIFGVLLLSSYVSETIGIHALFGAFIAGVIMPSKLNFRHVLASKIEDLALVLLLPLFFVFTGLRTQIGLLNTFSLWGVCLTIIAIAIVGKFLGSALAARFVGQSWKDSLIIGALMNTRGLMELVVLNIGYDIGVLSPQIFVMLVIMALVTTFLTGPAIDLIERISKKLSAKEERIKNTMVYNILISFSFPASGIRLLKLATVLSIGAKNETRYTALHLTPSADIAMHEAETFEKEGFAPVLKYAGKNNIPIKTAYRATNEVSSEIVNYTNKRDFDLLLVGSSRPMFSSEETGGKIKSFIEDIDCPVGVLVDKGFKDIKNLLVIMADPTDSLLENLVRDITGEGHINCTVMDQVHAWHKKDKDKKNRWLTLKDSAGSESLNTSYLNQFDIVVTSLKGWRHLKQMKAPWLNNLPSVLIIKGPKKVASSK